MNFIYVFWVFVSVLFGFFCGAVVKPVYGFWWAVLAIIFGGILFWNFILLLPYMLPRFGRIPFEKLCEKEGLIYQDDEIWVEELENSVVFEIPNGKRYTKSGSSIYEVVDGGLGDVVMKRNKFGRWKNTS